MYASLNAVQWDRVDQVQQSSASGGKKGGKVLPNGERPVERNLGSKGAREGGFLQEGKAIVVPQVSEAVAQSNMQHTPS